MIHFKLALVVYSFWSDVLCFGTALKLIVFLDENSDDILLYVALVQISIRTKFQFKFKYRFKH